MSENLLKKIAAKQVCGTFVAPKIGEEQELMIIMGYAKSMEKKATNYGDSTAFHGDFKAINTITGEAYRSGTCYLPDVASDMLENIMSSNAGTVEFGFKISIIGVKGRNPGEDGKYEYRCKPLLESAENDPLKALEGKITQKLIAHKEAAKGKGK